MVKQIIKEAIEKNPIGLKEAVESELRARVALVLGAKTGEMSETVDLEEAKNPNALDIKIPELDKAGIDYEVFQSAFKRSKKDIHVKSSDDAIAGRKLIEKNPAYANFRITDTTPSSRTK